MGMIWEAYLVGVFFLPPALEKYSQVKHWIISPKNQGKIKNTFETT